MENLMTVLNAIGGFLARIAGPAVKIILILAIGIIAAKVLSRIIQRL